MHTPYHTYGTHALSVAYTYIHTRATPIRKTGACCAYTHALARMHTHTYTHATLKYARLVPACAYTCSGTHAYTYVHTRNSYTRMTGACHAYTHTDTHTHTYTHTHTHKQTNTHKRTGERYNIQTCTVRPWPLRGRKI